MRILFVGSGNTQFGISPVTKNQGNSLKDKGFDISYYKIIGKGISGYLRNVIKLHRYVKKTNYDIIHVHYSLSAFVVSLSFSQTEIPNTEIETGIPHREVTLCSFFIKAVMI